MTPRRHPAVFRHIIGVPTAQIPEDGRPKMIAGAAEGEGQVQLRHALKIDLEKGGVLQGELSIEKPLQAGASANAQRRLNAGEIRALGEVRRRFTQLPRVRRIFGVIDGDQFALDEGKGVVEGARLGLGRARRHNQDLQPVRPGCGRRRRNG